MMFYYGVMRLLVMLSRTAKVTANRTAKVTAKVTAKEQGGVVGM
jgi:hypothetical protein